MTPLPKAGSGAFKTLLAHVQKTLDLPRMVVVVEGALDRRQLEDVAKRILKGRPMRAKQFSKPQLVGLACDSALTDPYAAFAVFRALDRSSNKERHIVASIDEEDIHDRIASYRALDFRRERARLIWALLRDGRDKHRDTAEYVLRETFNSMRPTENDTGFESTAELEEQLAKYEKATVELSKTIKHGKDQVANLEEERSKLLAKIGMRERQLKEEQERRRDVQQENKKLKGDLKELRKQLESVSQTELEEALKERDQLRDKARALENRLEHAEKLRALEEENQELKEELELSAKERDDLQARFKEQLRKLTARERAAHERVKDLRANLKTARRLAAAPKDPLSLAGGEPVVERVGLFVDAENLIASARRDHGGKFDFRAMLPELVGERKKVMAIAFIVEKASDASTTKSDFHGFVRALQAAGYEVRQKKKRVRIDGTSKADWDMGMAMEIIDARNRLDVVILCSGDGDFVPLVQRLKRWRRRVEVASFLSSTQQELIRVCDGHTDLTGRFRA